MPNSTRLVIFIRTGALLIALHVACSLAAADRFEFTRMVAHWSDYSDPGYLSFIDDARPELAQVGFYGAHFWSLADTPFGNGYPAHLPVRGHRECAQWFKNLNAELHRRGVKVIGHFNLKFLIGDPESPNGSRGFFRSYEQQWDEKLLGPKPNVGPIDFLEKDSSGKPLVEQNYSIGGMHEYWACLNNPHWREVLKAWVRFAISQGVDGLIANYFYRHDCHCQYCVAAFRKYLAAHFSPDELENRFSIGDLAAQDFEEIVGWHDPAQTSPLRLQMLRFSQIANKEAFDEVLTEYGRSLKPDLIVAQWNHLGDFNQISGDERCLLPDKLWGRNENYLWYSTGDAANSTDLSTGILGEATLQARYIRGAFDDKPFTLGKYESVRIRAAIAELAANGGAPMGFYTNFKDPAARTEIVRYYNFLRKNDSLYRANRSYAEAFLLFPRSRVHEGDIAAVTRFKDAGKRLLEAHVLFDVLPDDHPRPAERKVVRVFDPSTNSILNQIAKLPSDFSRFECPNTVRVSASRPAEGKELTLHFVNYNRHEQPDKSRGSGIQDEKPIAAPEALADMLWKGQPKVRQIEFLTPEVEELKSLNFEIKDDRLRFRVPGFLVYAVVRIHLD